MTTQDRIIRKSEISHRTGLSDATIRRMEQAGKFPHRIQLNGKKSVGWIESEINAWLAGKAAQRTEGGIQ